MLPRISVKPIKTKGRKLAYHSYLEQIPNKPEHGVSGSNINILKLKKLFLQVDDCEHTHSGEFRQQLFLRERSPRQSCFNQEQQTSQWKFTEEFSLNDEHRNHVLSECDMRQNTNASILAKSKENKFRNRLRNETIHVQGQLDKMHRHQKQKSGLCKRVKLNQIVFDELGRSKTKPKILKKMILSLPSRGNGSLRVPKIL